MTTKVPTTASAILVLALALGCDEGIDTTLEFNDENDHPAGPVDPTTETVLRTAPSGSWTFAPWIWVVDRGSLFQVVRRPTEFADTYFVGVDESVTFEGHPTNLIARLSFTDSHQQALSIDESWDVSDLRGQRLRITAPLKVEDAVSAVLWVEVRDEGGRTLMLVDGLGPLGAPAASGTQEFAPFVHVIDVPTKAKRLYYGTRLIGQGKVWTGPIVFQLTGWDQPLSPVAPI